MLKHCLLMSLLAAASLNARADLVVLQYHHVDDSTPPSTSTSVSLFRAQMDMVDTMGLPVVPLKEGTVKALEGDDRKEVAITFDDAYDSVYETAAPLLEDHGFPYTVFVNTDAVGRTGYMTWEQLRTLSGRPGVTIANHSADHAHLVQRPDENAEDWNRRVDQSLDRASEALQNRLESDPTLFAYPYGEFDVQLQKKLRDRQWYGYGQQSGPIGPGSDSTRMPRFPMANAYGQLGSLKSKLKSLAFPTAANALPDSVIRSNPPALDLTLSDAWSPKRLTCFASGMGRIEISIEGQNRVNVEAPRPFDSRRFRYNCTYPAGNGHFFWLSQPWLDLSRPED